MKRLTLFTASVIRVRGALGTASLPKVLGKTRGCTPDCNVLQPVILPAAVIGPRCCIVCMLRIYASRPDNDVLNVCDVVAQLDDRPI